MPLPADDEGDCNKSQLDGLSPVVMVVDDDAIVRLIHTKLVQKNGCRAVTAGSVEQAKQSFSKAPYAMFLLDGHLPDGSACEIVRLIRSDPRFLDIPIIAISSDDSDGHVLKLMDAGIDEFLTKPVSAKQMKEILQHYSVVAAESD